MFLFSVLLNKEGFHIRESDSWVMIAVETFVRADGAFIPFADDFDMSTVTTSVKGVGAIGDVKIIDLQSPISSLIGKQVIKVGRSSGLTTGTVLAYALEYNDEKGICFLTDFLVVGENQLTFDLEGDSGSLIMLKGLDIEEKPRPIGIIWGGTANRGRLKLKIGQPPENWTSGVDLGRLLNLLELDLIANNQGLKGLLSLPTITPTAFRCVGNITPKSKSSSFMVYMTQWQFKNKELPPQQELGLQLGSRME